MNPSSGEFIEFSPSQSGGDPIVTMKIVGLVDAGAFEVTVDTGASLCIISEGMARTAGYDDFEGPADSVVKPVGGPPIPVWTRNARLCLTNGACEYEWSAEVGVVKLALDRPYFGCREGLDYFDFVRKANRGGFVFEAGPDFPGTFRRTTDPSE